MEMQSVFSLFYHSFRQLTHIKTGREKKVPNWFRTKIMKTEGAFVRVLLLWMAKFSQKQTLEWARVLFLDRVSNNFIPIYSQMQQQHTLLRECFIEIFSFTQDIFGFSSVFYWTEQLNDFISTKNKSAHENSIWSACSRCSVNLIWVCVEW